MLTLLKINNLALVENLLWEPEPGFICITGETGAGKSVIVGAIRLALGERADKTLIRTGARQCTVEAVFCLPADSPVHVILHEHGIPPCEDGVLIIKRSMAATDNRQFVNDSPCTLALLREIGAFLVDMHGPNDHRSLTAAERQLSLLDAFGNHGDLLQNYRAVWQKRQQVRRAYTELERTEAATAHEIDLLRHQLNEIDSAGFTAEEVQNLEERWQRARNSSRLQEQVGKMLGLFGVADMSGLNTQLRELSRAAHELQRLDSTATDWLAPLEGVCIELEHMESALADYAAGLESDPQAFAQLEERINTLETLKMKYGADFAEICRHRHEVAHRLDHIENRGEHLAQLQETLEKLDGQLKRAAAELSLARKAHAPELAAAIAAHSQELGFKQSVFTIQLNPSEEPGAQGAETVEFLFSPNPGEPPKPLRLIASGGELARIMLAIKSALANQDATPLLVFDEIDANVGGEIARAVGCKMQQLGTRHQVIAITHFPQVAALAEHHYLVQKTGSANRTISFLQQVESRARIDELARMLGGGGDHARTLAQALLRRD